MPALGGGGELACHKNDELLVAAQHGLGRGRGRPRHVHAGGLRLPRGRADADEERGHIAGKNVLIFGLCSLVYWAVGFGIAFGTAATASSARSGFFPSVGLSRAAVGERAVRVLHHDPRRRGLPLRGRLRRRLARDRLGRDGRAGEALGLLRLRGLRSRSSTRSSRTGSGADGWLFSLGMQDFAGSTVVHYQGALAALAGAILLGPRIGKFGRRPRQPDPGPQHPVRRARDDHPLVRLVRLQPGLDARRRHRRQARLLRLRRDDDEHRGRGRGGQRHRSSPGSCSGSRTSR